MADQDPSQMQARMQAAMQQQLAGASQGTNEGAKELATAARSLQQTSSAAMQQSQSLAQMVQSQQQQIANLTSSVSALTGQVRMDRSMAGAGGGMPQMGGGFPSPSAPQMSSPTGQGLLAPPGEGWSERMRGWGGSAWDKAKSAASMGAPALGRFAISQTLDAKETLQSSFRNFLTPSSVVSGPGGISSAGGNKGFFGNMLAQTIGIGAMSSSKSHSFGQFQEATAMQMNRSAQDLARATPGAMGSMMNAYVGNKLGAPIGKRIGRALTDDSELGGMVGGVIGMFGGPVLAEAIGKRINPFNLAGEQLGRAAMFGSAASTGAYGFMRGQGGLAGNQFVPSDEMAIGMEMADFTRKDLMLNNQDMSNIAGGMSESGQLAGVQSARQYTDRVKKAVDNAKMVMKTLNMSSEEAVSFMGTAFNTVGVNHGAEMMRFSARARVSATLSAMSPAEQAQMAASGAGQYSQMGMMAGTGAMQAMNASSLAGVSSVSMDRGLLASVGGERGLSEIISNSVAKSLSGPSGTILGFNRGSSGNIMQGMSQMAGGMQSGDDIVSFVANKHKRIEEATGKMGEFGMLGQQSIDLNFMASELKGVGGTHEDRMKLLARNQFGLNETEADALVQSMGNLPETMRRASKVGTKSANNAISDDVFTNQSLLGRATLQAREVLTPDSLVRGYGEFSTDLGNFTENVANRASASFGGIQRRYNSESVVEAMGDFDLDSMAVKNGVDLGRSTADTELIRNNVLFDKSQSFFSPTKGLGIDNAVANLNSTVGSSFRSGLDSVMHGAGLGGSSPKHGSSDHIISDARKILAATNPNAEATPANLLASVEAVGVSGEALRKVANALSVGPEMMPGGASAADVDKMISDVGISGGLMADPNMTRGYMSSDLVYEALDAGAAVVDIWLANGEKPSKEFHAAVAELIARVNMVEDSNERNFVTRELGRSGVRIIDGRTVDLAGVGRGKFVDGFMELGGFTPTARTSREDLKKTHKAAKGFETRGAAGHAIQQGLQLLGGEKTAMGETARKAASRGIRFDKDDRIIGADFGAIGKEFRGMDVEKITDDNIRGIVEGSKNKTEEELGKLISQDLMKRGTSSGVMVTGSKVGDALSGSSVGSESLRETVRAQQLNNAVMAGLLQQLQSMKN